MGGRTKDSSLFLAALLLSASQWGARIGGQNLLFAVYPASLTDPAFMFWQFLLESVPFLVSPVLLFFVFYKLGKGVPLAERYLHVSGLLFSGGVVGAGATFFLFPLALGAGAEAAFPSPLSVVATVLGFLYIFVGFGLGALFPGFVATAVANFRGKGRDAGGPDTGP